MCPPRARRRSRPRRPRNELRFLIVGLGNPGPEYAETRHNSGFLVVEELARRWETALDRERFHGRFGTARAACGPDPGEPADSARDGAGRAEVGLLCPLTYMNRSGRSVAAALAAYPGLDPATDLLIVIDDLDLPFGRLRLRPGGGAGGHRGLADVIEALGREGVPRLRIGIGRPPPERDPVDYVLSAFDAGEACALPDLLSRAADAVEAVLREGVAAAMTAVNRAPACD